MADKIKLISTSALSKKKNIPAKEFFEILTNSGLIERFDDQWKLTDKGKSKGGEYKSHAKFGEYVVWPENIEIESTVTTNMISATKIGKEFNIQAKKINHILSELGWLEKALKGWKLTKSGERIGGIQKEDFKSGIPYVVWPENIIKNSSLISTVKEVLGDENQEKKTETNKNNFREKFEAKHRSADGHYVRSKAEAIIDNWLYMAEIVHAYERKLPVEEDVYSDFYLPAGKVYIEFWGLENEPKYKKRKEIKKDIYKKYNFNLIELNDSDVQNIDDILPKMLLKYNIQAY